MRLQDFDDGEVYQAKVITNHPLTAATSDQDVRELVLQVTHLSFTYQIGQSVGVIVPGNAELGHEHHFRMYSIADSFHTDEQGFPRIKLCVKRCDYVDPYSGERFPGIASHYLCDSSPGDVIKINGPFGQVFPVPTNKNAPLILIGLGTGIAPFRAFIKHLYGEQKDWQGQVTLFHGAVSGLDTLYMNEHRDDFKQYYDEQTFEAIKAVSDRPRWDKSVDMQKTLGDKAQVILDALQSEHGCVYVAGHMEVNQNLDEIFADLLGNENDWQTLKNTMKSQQRWIELLY